MKQFSLLVLLTGTTLSSFAFYTSVDSASFYFNKAKELSIARKVLEADKNFQKALVFNPASDDIRLAYADYLTNNRKLFPAVEQVGKVLEKNLNNTIALQKMTDLSFQLRRWNDVILYGNKLVQTGGGPKVLFMVGKSYFELENFGKAQRFLTDAFTEDPKHTESVTLLGKVLIELSNYKQAIAVYNKSLELDPNNSQLTYELGLLYYAMNNEREAAKYFEVAVAKGYKADLDYYENLGLAQLSFDLDKGVKTLEKVLEMKPNSSEILFQVAQAYYKVEKFTEAASTYTKIYENDPNNSRALYMSGVAYQKKGDKQKGITLCEMAIRMDPNLAQLKSAKTIF